MRVRILSVSLAVCLSITSVQAWDGLGHMAVAYIAFQNLNGPVRQEVSRLVQLNPLYKQWVAGVPQPDRDLRAFMIAATWPDIIKGDGQHVSDGPDGGNRPPNGPQATQNKGYSDRNMHKYWHFKDVPFSCDGTRVENAPDANAQNRIEVFSQTLSSPKPPGMSKKKFDKLKSYDLVWLLHLAGDVHQPLHCTSRFTQTQPAGDAGGNLVTIACDMCPGKLHTFWDDVLGTSKNPDDAGTVAKNLAAADPQLGNILAAATWVQESFTLAQSGVYMPPVGCGPGPFTLDAGYIDAAKIAASKQVALAGLRLANLLNASVQ